MTHSGPPDLSRLKIARKDESFSQKKTFFNFSVWILLFAMLLLVAGFLFFRGPSEDSLQGVAQREEVSETSKRERSFDDVKGGPLQIARGEVLDGTGYVVAQRKASVSSKATGRLKALRVVEGDKVQAGQEIGVLENDDMSALVEEQKAEVAAAEAKVRFAEAELVDARSQRDRQRKLSLEKVVSSAQLDASEARFLKAEAEVNSAQANLTVMKARLAKAKVDLEYTYIRAPFDGTVLTKDADIGEVVAPFGNSTNARAAVVTIADMTSLQVEADVSESHISEIYVGQACSIRLDSYPDKKYDGVVSSIVPTVDRAKATVQVKIRFLKADAAVLPEMSAKVSFVLGKIEK